MYSENDFRYYQGGALSHAEGEKKIWDWLPGGKNPPEYNKWYYATHPEKWGITKAAKDVYNKAKDLAENTETDLDDRALAALGRGANRVKEGLKNNSVVSNTRRSTEALQRRDSAQRKANDARAKADEAYKAGRTSQAERYYKEAQGYERQAKTYGNQARAARNNAGTAIQRGARNTVENVGRSARNLGQRALNATTIDDSLREAGRAVKQAGYEAGSRAVGAVRSGAEAVGRTARSLGQRALDATTIDEKLGTAAGALRRGDFRGAASSARAAGREAGERLGNAARNTGRRVLDSTNLDERAADAIGRAESGLRRAGNAITGAGRNVLDTAGRGVGAVVGGARALGQRALDATNRDRNAAARDLETARSNYNELARQSSNAIGRMMDRAEETGDPVSAQNAFRDLAADLARQNVSTAQRQTREAEGAYNRAQDRYDQTPLGRAENAARNLKNSVGTADEAEIEATKAVKAAVNDYWDAVDKYGVNSPQAKAAATAAEGKMNSVAVSIIGRFGNAKDTIEGVIDDGQEWLDSITENITPGKKK